MIVLKEPLIFEWDQGNKEKNTLKHKVTNEECEEVFFDHKKKILNDVIHSGQEERCLLLGKTKKERRLFIVFTISGPKIRVISARDLNKKEVCLYEEEN
ncbi:MAG: hypothetical protein A3G32_01880 [Deltaproteobacteria bacterium RIFCSPLOWO2_12_FULL_40_28]|nr:MAG: hypothetical protein A3C45_06625 [Deltaproteobacteria bacterium RIFCSPHIGHO2_02_FULL_40_28]OGQ18880.1 MAG: hypothetical protein A3E27_09260 [Deltaproteobacteria bacterium RIFCSPHIGHO2_12_FULL_40_32]OGQ40125.1 MAG: hypothetical protein A3I69_01790 [Deltaproteobacteria bacterium RIFCSPLOWO2_02_FULL_40_36]OGQ53308.1 MAG: hypothetical protein A3G32_01880 [Deltaproteobacteria bacterium RIFCSPLOWO2_12_FULL_40_28]